MKRVFVVILVIVLSALAIWLTRHSALDEESTESAKSASQADLRFESYATSDSCKECHRLQYESWHRTYHRTMTQPASVESVVGDFNDVRLAAYGREYHLQRSDGQFLVTMVPPEWETGLLLSGIDPMSVPDPPVVTRPIIQTTGSHLMQTYWVQGDDGLRQMPWFFHIEEQMWIPAEDSFLTPPDSNRIYSIWNMQCLKCHATGGQPRQNKFDGRFHSKVPEPGIACEACHGAAKEHISFHSRAQPAEARPLTDPIFNPARSDHISSSQTCGQCHSSSVARDMEQWLHGGSEFRPGGNFTEFSTFELPSEKVDDHESRYVSQAYWNDGSCRVGGDELLGLMKSACYLKGKVSCLSCHSMHNSDPTDQLRDGMRTNDACLQCHSEYEADISRHTHHAADSTGSLCYNCHMPHTAYALFKAIRSHRIDSPHIEGLSKSGRPNACNLCHLDRTLAWSSGFLNQWYRLSPPDIPESESSIPAGILWLLRGDALQRVIAAWHMGWSPARSMAKEGVLAPFLAATLNDPYAAVRFVAWRSLRKYPGLQDVTFSFTGDADLNTIQRDAAFQAVSEAFPDVPVLSDAAIQSTDFTELLQKIEQLQASQNRRPIHIPE